MLQTEIPENILKHTLNYKYILQNQWEALLLI